MITKNAAYFYALIEQWAEKVTGAEFRGACLFIALA
jgi:hypothetical protein